MTPTRILLVDDYPYFLRAATGFLAMEPQFEIVGTAFSAEEALQQILLLQPDVVLLDYALPDMNGLEILRRIKASPNAPCVIIVTLHNYLEYRQAVEKVGGDGFITKSEFGNGISDLIKTLFKPK